MITRMFPHAMTTPLWAMRGYFELVAAEREAGRIVDSRGYLDRIQQVQAHMSELVKAMERLAAVSLHEVRAQTVDLSAIVRSHGAALQEANPERRVVLNVQDAVLARTDASLISQAVSQLLDNAWKFTSGRPVGEVFFAASGSSTVREEIPYLTCSIRDNGAGFDESLSYKLFAPYQRLHAEPRFAGMGMGLACVRRIVHRLGGRVWARGEPNVGATFFFTIEAGRERET